MIEIIPNWHPLLVHFTVGLLTTSVFFYLASAVLSHTNSWKRQWLNMANWSLWSGCLFAIATAIAGWLAYNSVAHDSASHAAMTLHRNWALPTASTFLLLGLWAIFIARKDRRPGFLFLTFSIIAAGLLMVTGWLGAEAVYRYGLGVKSLPVVTKGADGHNHSHGSEHDESTMEKDEHQHGTTKIEQPLTEDAHQYSHENKDIPSETEPSKPGVEESVDGHNHSHGSKNNESGKIDYQDTTTEIEQLFKENVHQHNHENQKTLPETEQPLRQDGHQHEHKSKNTLSKIEQTNDVTEHTHKTMTDDNTEPTIQSSTIESHVHDSNSIEPIETPLDQDNTSEETPLSPSELHYLYHTEEQNEEVVNEETHSHDHDHEY